MCGLAEVVDAEHGTSSKNVSSMMYMLQLLDEDKWNAPYPAHEVDINLGGVFFEF